MFNKLKIKRLITGVLTLILVIGYFIAIDPDTKLMSDLTYGVSLFMTLEVFAIGVLAILIIEFLPDAFLDRVFPKEEETFDKALETSAGASNILIAKSLRILAYAILLSASIITYGAKF